MTVKVKGTFKKDQREYNGLEAIAKELIENPLERHYVVAMIETSKIDQNIEDGGSKNATVRHVSIEPVDGDDAIVVKEILDKRFKTRTGRHVEPSLFDVDDPQGRDDAVHLGEILAGQLPFLEPDGVTPADESTVDSEPQGEPDPAEDAQAEDAPADTAGTDEPGDEGGKRRRGGRR